MPLFVIGIKDTNLIEEDKENIIKKHIAIEILLNMLIGKSSKTYKDLYEQGILMAEPYLEYEFEKTYAHIAITGQSKEPKKVLEVIQNKINVKELIIKINKKVDLISGINLIFDSRYKISSEKIKFILDELKEYYDTIIIDTSSECFYDYTKNILNNSDYIIFLLEGNLLEIKKANNLLKIYTEEWKLKKEKINIIINKYNENAVDDKIIKNIFSEYKILGKIKFNKKYNTLINKNFEEDLFTKNIKKEYEKISDKIIKLKNRKMNLIIENIYNRFKFNVYQKLEIKNNKIRG